MSFQCPFISVAIFKHEQIFRCLFHWRKMPFADNWGVIKIQVNELLLASFSASFLQIFLMLSSESLPMLWFLGLFTCCSISEKRSPPQLSNSSIVLSSYLRRHLHSSSLTTLTIRSHCTVSLLALNTIWIIYLFTYLLPILPIKLKAETMPMICQHITQCWYNI